MNKILFGGLIALIVWTSGSSYIWVCKYKGYCLDEQEESILPPAEGEKAVGENVTAPKANPGEWFHALNIPDLSIKEGGKTILEGKGNIVSQLSSADIKHPESLNEAFGKLKDLLDNSPQKTLSIHSYYDSNSEKPSDKQDFGTLRKASLEKILVEHHIPTDRIQWVSQAKEGLFGSGNQASTFAFEWMDEEKMLASLGDETAGQTPATVQLTKHIQFDYGSDQMKLDADLTAYFGQIAQQLKKSGKKATIIGHTDDQGSETFNKSLGQRRATSLKSFLVSKGVDAKQLTASSMGEEQPIADNATEEGREANRRVEIILK